MDNKQYFYKITTNFPFFAQHVRIKARDWKRLPNDSKIKEIPFRLAEHQRKYIEYISRTDISSKVVLKCRQKGFSVVTLMYVLWLIMYGANNNILFMIKKDKDAKKFVNTIKDILQSLPERIKPKVKVLNSGLIKCRSNTLAIQTAGDGEGARSGTYSMVILDELAYYKESTQENIMSGLASACPNNRLIISTPKKEDDLYHNLVLKAKAEDTLFTHNYYDDIESWFGTKEMADAWYTEQAKDLTQPQRVRELDCEFAGALDNLAWQLEPDMFQYYNANSKTHSIVSADLGYLDDTAILYATDYNGILSIYSEYSTNQRTIPQIVQTIKSDTNYIKYLTIDSSSKKVDQTSGISAYRQLKQLLGRPIFTHKIPDQLEMVRIAQTALLRGQVKIDPRCVNLIKALNNTQIKEGKIVRNEFKHYNDSFVYLVLNWMAVKRKRPTRAKITNYSNLRAMIG